MFSDRVRGERDAAIVAIPDARLGHVIHLATTGDAGDIVQAFNGRVTPFERIRVVHWLESIPRSPLGKVLRGEVLTRIAAQGGHDGDAVQDPQRKGE